jgi:hypothetical protein
MGALMRCQYLAGILAKRVKSISPLSRPLECLTLSAAHGVYGFGVGQHGVGEYSDKVVSLRAAHGVSIVLGFSLDVKPPV